MRTSEVNRLGMFKHITQCHATDDITYISSLGSYLVSQDQGFRKRMEDKVSISTLYFWLIYCKMERTWRRKGDIALAEQFAQVMTGAA